MAEGHNRGRPELANEESDEAAAPPADGASPPRSRAAEEAGMFTPGDTVSHFRIEGRLGGGGMGVVYRAEDTRLGRPVALKFLPAELSRDPEARTRFEIEARSASALDHANICTIYEVAETADGRLYIAMALYQGRTLQARLKDGPLAIGEAVDLARQIAAGLHRAHEQGIVHRDIKPANLVVTRHGEVRILDFGIAKLTGEVGLTRTGVSMGTLAYMAPEQAGSEALGPPADLWALGAVLYEMLTGRSPFQRETAAATQAAVLTGNRAPLLELRPDIPPALAELVDELLTVEPDGRPKSAQEVNRRLASQPEGSAPQAAAGLGAKGSPGRHRGILAATLVVLSVAAFTVWPWSRHRADEQRARTEVVPEVLRLAGENRVAEAAELALQAERILGADPLLDPLWPALTTRVRAVTDPAGARLSFRPYHDPGASWEPLGETPYESGRFPMGAYRFRVELDGYRTAEVARSFISIHQLGEILNAGFDYLADPSYALDLELQPLGDPTGAEMTAVAGGPYGTVPVAGFGPLNPVLIPEFLIDRTEVTGRDYADFLAAGGYDDPAHWVEPLERDGRVVPFEEAQTEFVDATGRPGPAGWSLGQLPAGEEDLPVRGVSWFEASAFCAWKDKSLPTLYHWARATLPSSDSWRPFTPLLIEASNFDRRGPVPVATLDAIGVSGAHDLVGNVREWSSTALGTDRLLLGGSWSDPVYRTHDVSGADPWQRGETNGFRCVRYTEGVPESLELPFSLPRQDFSQVVPVPDAVFEANRAVMEYDRSLPLNATLDSTRVLDWGATREWVSIDTPYGDRMPLRLHIPPGAEPPYEAVVYFPGGNVLRSTHMDDLDVVPLDFLVRAGRVLVEPAYDGAFQRNDDRTVQRWTSPESRRELIRHWVQDLGRTLDYLEARPDVDGSTVAYLGMSFGATMMPDFLAYEPRFSGAILYSGGFGRTESQASIDARSDLAQRVTTPILQLGSLNDFYSPQANQEAMFDFFGAPETEKRMQIYDSGHWPLPMNEVIRETVDFLERVQGTGGG